MTLRSAIITGTANININGTVGATTPATGKFTTIEGTDTTDATSTTAAAVKTAGGLAVAKKVYVGDNVVPAAAKGVNFTGNTPAAGMTSQLLTWYEEGYKTGVTITPETSGTITLIANYDVLAYTRIGRSVACQGQLKIDSVSSPIGTYVKMTLPFSIKSLDNISGRFGASIVSDISGVYLNYPVIGISGDSFVSIYLTAATITAAKSFFVSFSYVA